MHKPITSCSNILLLPTELDDTNANDASHGTGTAPSSYFIKDALNGVIGTAVTADFVIPDMTNTLELTYNAGTITLKRTSPTPELTLTVTDADAYDVGHIFVSTALDKYALWEICGLGKLLVWKYIFDIEV